MTDGPKLGRTGNIGRNELCPCGSGKKYKRCHGDAAHQDRVQRAFTAAEINLRRHQANEHRRKAQQGLGRPIISAEIGDHRFIAAGNRVYYGKAWKTFSDFLLYFLGNTLGRELGKAELEKPEAEMHPVALWHRRICRLQAVHKGAPGEVFSAPETGASRAYLELAYDLFLLEHNAELRRILIARLKMPDQFAGGLSEIRVAGMFVRAGFGLKFEDETDATRTHHEYNATRHVSGKVFSVEVKTKHWESFPRNDIEGLRKVRIHIGRLLRDALEKYSEHERLVFIELAMPDEAQDAVSAPQPWWMQAALDAIRDTERLLVEKGKPVPTARVIVCNHPYQFHLDSTRSVVGMVCDGIGPNDFRSGRRSSIREAARLREKHADFLALWDSVEKHRKIPQTYDGSSVHLADSDLTPQSIVGNQYSVPNASGQHVDAVLEQAIAVPSEQRIYGIYISNAGERFICANSMTDAEIKAYAENPETFFGVVQPTTSIDDPVDLYLRLLETYRNSSKETLLGFMSTRPDVVMLRELPREELAEIYCESLANAVAAQAEAAKITR